MSAGVIIVAAGRSTRMGADVPKPLLDLGGRTMLQRSVEVFDVHPGVGRIRVGWGLPRSPRRSILSSWTTLRGRLPTSG
jgi:CTP:molybdopterin cytidylyltransferase MocA